jgi:O-antigen/teichoic acid export membrane protein
MLAIFVSVAQAFVDSGFGNALIRKADRTDTDCATAFYFNIVVAIAMYGILYVAAPWIAGFYRMPLLTDVVRLLSLTIVISALGIVPRALRSVAVDFKSQAYASVTAAIVSGLVGLYMAYSGYGVWALVLQQVAYALISVGVIWLLARWWPQWVYSWRSFRTLFSYGSKLLASRLLHVVYTNASNLVIGKFYTPADLGYYDRGYQLASFPSLKLSDVLHTVTFPILAKLQGDNARLVHVYHRYVAMTSMVVFFVMTLLAAVAEPLVVMLLTEKWVGTVPFLRVLCLALMFDSICRLNNNMLLVKGWSGLFFRLEVIKKVVIVPVFLLAVHLGVMAICCVAVVHTAVDISCSTYYLRKLLGVSGSEYRSVVRYFVLSVVACVPAYLICSLDLSPWIALPVAVVMASGIYWMFLHKDENMRELWFTVHGSGFMIKGDRK